MTTSRLDDFILSDEAGFACSKTKLVDDGLPHLRPFNISDDGGLIFSQLYQVPRSEAPRGKVELLRGDILFNNTNSIELVGKSAVVRGDMRAGFSNHLTRLRVDAGASIRSGLDSGCVACDPQASSRQTQRSG